MAARVAVVGAGVVGLSTALNIQGALRQAAVTVVADGFGQETVSDGAAGLFIPTFDRLPGVQLERARQWSAASFRHYDSVAHSAEAAKAGIFVVSGYTVSDKPEELPLYGELVYGCRDCTEHELEAMGQKGRFGRFATTLLVECRRYLPWLLQRFKDNGGHVEKRKVASLEEFVGSYDVVVNCTGLGSRSLLGDTVVQAMRGQVMRVSAPWLKTYYRDVATDTSIVPCYDSVLLGATRQMDNYDVTTQESDQKEVWDHCCRLVPAMASSKILWQWTGLRPWRVPLRLHSDVMAFPTGDLKVVHNYGHGSCGVAISWGTAVEAAQLVTEVLGGAPQPTAKL